MSTQIITITVVLLAATMMAAATTNHIGPSLHLFHSGWLITVLLSAAGSSTHQLNSGHAFLLVCWNCISKEGFFGPRLVCIVRPISQSPFLSSTSRPEGVYSHSKALPVIRAFACVAARPVAEWSWSRRRRPLSRTRKPDPV